MRWLTRRPAPVPPEPPRPRPGACMTAMEITREVRIAWLEDQLAAVREENRVKTDALVVAERLLTEYDALLDSLGLSRLAVVA